MNILNQSQHKTVKETFNILASVEGSLIKGAPFTPDTVLVLEAAKKILMNGVKTRPVKLALRCVHLLGYSQEKIGDSRGSDLVIPLINYLTLKG